MKKIINILWLKKNLRTKDNQCLSELDPNIPTVAVYFFESDIIQETDFSDFHLQFITSSLLQLEISLKKI
jgi:deoxyribodipyrimidine photolyase